MARSVNSVSVALAFALAACGGSQPAADAPGASTAPPSEETPAPSAPAAETPAGGGWEGEAEAKGGDAAPSEQVPPKAADSGVAETRTMDVIAKLVKDNRQPVRDCYEKARKELPSLQGDLVIHFALDPEGKVKLIEVNQQRTTLKSPPVSDCAIKTIKGISFPASSRGMETEVNYPYNFKP
jgi:hypothetical protein